MSRMKPTVRREQILTAAMTIAERDGFNALTRDGIAEEAGVATGMVNHVFSTMDKLRKAVMRSAVHKELKPIIATGLSSGMLEAREAPEWLKREALETLMDEV